MTTRGVGGMRRRTVLQGALAGSVVAGTAVAGGNQALAAGPHGVSPVGPDVVRVVHGPAGTAVQVPAELGVEISVGAGGSRGVTDGLSYDERLYAVAAKPVLVRGKQVIPMQARSAGTGVAHGQLVEVQLPELAPGTYTLHAGGGSPARFPADLVADPVATEVKVSERGAVTAWVLSRPVGEQGLPWGAQLGAAWQQASWADGYYAWHPSLVTLHSVGPGVVPVGARVRVTLDRQVFESVQLTTARGSHGERIGWLARRGTLADQPVTTWTLHTPVAAGSRITLTCLTKLRPLRGALDYIEPALVEFLPAKDSKTPQRLTGQETQTRADDVYSAATRALRGW